MAWEYIKNDFFGEEMKSIRNQFTAKLTWRVEKKKKITQGINWQVDFSVGVIIPKGILFPSQNGRKFDFSVGVINPRGIQRGTVSLLFFFPFFFHFFFKFLFSSLIK